MVGGIAIYVAFVFSIFFIPPLEESLAPFFCGVTLLLAVGIFDDRQGMDARTKLLGQTAAALIMIVPNQKAMVGHLGNLLGQGDILLAGAAMPLTVLFVVASINAFNMIDGLDGVAGGVAAVGLLWLAAIAELAGRTELATLALLLVCAVAGFLLFNLRHPWRSRAAVFMGDAGSMVIGAVLAFLTVRLSQGTEDIVSTPATLLWTIALPGIDMLSVIVRRAVRLRSPFAADRTHLHHVLLDCGFSPRSAAFILIALAALMGGFGTLGLVLDLPDYVMAWGSGPAHGRPHLLRRMGMEGCQGQRTKSRRTPGARLVNKALLHKALLQGATGGMVAAFFGMPHLGGTYSVFRNLRPGLGARAIELRWVGTGPSKALLHNPWPSEMAWGTVVSPQEADEQRQASALVEHLEHGGYDAVFVNVLADRVQTNAVRYLDPRVLRVMVVHNITPGTYAAAAGSGTTFTPPCASRRGSATIWWRVTGSPRSGCM